MNLLSLTGALLTASASVFNHPLQQPKSKMMDVENKYQSNEVNSIDDLVIGNIYQLNCENLGIDEFLSFDGNIAFKLLTNLDFIYDYLEGDEVLSLFQYFSPNTYLNITYSDYSLIEVYYSVYQYQNEDHSASYVYNGYFTNNCVIQLVDFNFDDDYYQFLSYTDYNEIVPSNEHRGNLYTTIYDFFYGIFDTSDTNELSMTILGQSMSLTSWLAHSVTIILLFLGVLWLILVIRWIFRVCAGLVHV